MVFEMTLQQYLRRQHGMENQPMTMDLLLHPFGLTYQGEERSDLVLGMMLDHLSETFGSHDRLDPLDIATAAYGLGFEEAGRFLDEGPWLMANAVNLLKNMA